MNAAVGLMDGLGLDGDQCIRVIPQHMRSHRLRIHGYIEDITPGYPQIGPKCKPKPKLPGSKLTKPSSGQTKKI